MLDQSQTRLSTKLTRILGEGIAEEGDIHYCTAVAEDIPDWSCGNSVLESPTCLLIWRSAMFLLVVVVEDDVVRIDSKSVEVVRGGWWVRHTRIRRHLT